MHRILDLTFGDGTLVDDEAALAKHQTYLQWQVHNVKWHAHMHQAPYDELAVVLKETQTLIGLVGYVPCLDVYGQLPELRDYPITEPVRATPEVGLVWAIDPGHQGKGYATEAARTLIDYAFNERRLRRIIATTEYDNLASQRVMRKLGMHLARNPLPEPHWLQVVGILENSRTLD